MNPEIEAKPNWDEYFMDMAYLAAMRSIDPSTKCGCVVVSPTNNILSIGYNSPPRSCIDEEVPITRPEKYNYFVHAEENAILSAAKNGVKLDGSTFYITGYPCPRCFRGILNVGAKMIVYCSVKAIMITEEDEKAINFMLYDRNNLPKILFVQYYGRIGYALNKASNYINTRINQ